jgi:hypothetical protein
LFFTGDTPRYGSTNVKGDTKKITSRIIGVEVHCGPVHEVFLYYTDNLVDGGANIMIEIQRQGRVGYIAFCLYSYFIFIYIHFYILFI